MSKTKIIATLGPSSDNYTILRKMITAGLDVARFNFSHGTHQSHIDKINIIRKINKKYRRRIKLLQDLEGFRIRIGLFKESDSRILAKKKIFYFRKATSSSDPKIIPFDYEYDLNKISKGQFIYIDDGNIVLKVINSTKKEVKTEVVVGGILKSRKGINIPLLKIPFKGITQKDQKDIVFGCKHKFDAVAQSFVRNKKDIEDVRKLVQVNNPGCKIVAKIECKEAIKNIDKIIDVSDVIMIARGDMGVAFPIYEIPILQKIIIKKCLQKNKPVITATQMLESMTEHQRPTRAEVTDVANAIFDGTNYVMLSAESAAGKFPVESVQMMESVIRFTEKNIDEVKKILVKKYSGGINVI